MTNETKASHTPGPWTVGEGFLGGIGIQTQRGEFVCDLAEIADAKLIAAAPDLLEACKVALNFVDDVKVQKQVIAAIVKATGE